MKAKLQALFAKAKIGNSQLVAKFSAVIQWVLVFSVGAVISTAGAVAIWVYLQPVDKLRPKIEQAIKSQINAESVEIERLHWKFVPLRLGLGIEARNLKIVGGNTLKEVTLGRIWILSQPLKLFSGKLPLQVEFADGRVSLQSVSDGMEPRFVETDFYKHILEFLNSRWSKIVRIDFLLSNLGVDLAKNSDFVKFKKTEVSVQGFPGEFFVKSLTESSLVRDKTKISGDQRVEFRGFFQSWESKVVGVRIDDINLNLTDSEITSRFSFLKPVGMDWILEFNLQSTFTDDFGIKTLDLLDGRMALDESRTQFVGNVNQQKEYEFRWFSGPEEMESFNIPLSWIYKIPFRGFFEVSSIFKYSEKNGFEAQWKMEFNNFVVKMLDLKGLLDSGSSGEARFSFVNQVKIANGKVEVPRAEFQLAGTDSQIEFKTSRIVKPSGDALELLFKAGTKNDVLEIVPVNIKLNNLSLDAQAKIEGFSSFVLESKPGRLALDVVSNPVDLTQWTGYLPFFRKVPLEGVVQFSASADGPVFQDDNPFRKVSWRVDRMAASKIRGAFDQEGVEEFGIHRDFLQMSGPFVVDFLFTGRGEGSQIHRGSLLTQADLSKMGFLYRDWIRKPVGVPLVLDLSVDQQRNRLTVRRGFVSLHKAVFGVRGQIQRGANRGRLEVAMDKPINLSKWREFFPNLNPEMPLEGEILWNGYLNFEAQEEMEGSVELSALNLFGQGQFNDVSFPPSLLRYPVRNLNGRVQIEETGIFVPELKFRIGKSNFVGSGTAKPIVTKNELLEKGNISVFAEKLPWEYSGQMDIDNLTADLFKPTQEFLSSGISQNPGEGFNLKTFLEDPVNRFSKLKLRVRARNLVTEKTQSRDLGFIMNWEDGIFQIDPLKFLIWEGNIQGAFNMNARPFYERGEPLLWSFAGSLEKIDIEFPLFLQNSFYKNSIDGLITGQVDLTAKGFDLGEIWGSAQGRVRGRIDKGEFKVLKTMDLAVEEFATHSPAKEYFPEDFVSDRCFSPHFSGDFDGSFSDGDFKVVASSLSAGPDSKLSLNGHLRGSSLNLVTQFNPGEKCFSKELKVCLSPEQKLDLGLMNFVISGTVNEPEINFDPFEFGQSVVDCLRNRQAQIVQKMLDSEGNLPTENLKQKISERWKRLFRGE